MGALEPREHNAKVPAQTAAAAAMSAISLLRVQFKAPTLPCASVACLSAMARAQRRTVIGSFIAGAYSPAAVTMLRKSLHAT